jgi:plasmid stabilization system protein ParE
VPLIILSPEAVKDLQRIRQWYSQAGAGATAKAKTKRIIAAIKEIGRAPQRWPEGLLQNTQERVVAGHTIVYEASYANPISRRKPRRIDVLRIFGPGQDRMRRGY